MTKIDIFSGFLGAGKTTLIKKLIKEAYADQKIVLIENEFGEIGIDGSFLQDSGIQITEMNSGCICCTLVGDFSKALKKVLSDFEPDHILIEPSGVGKLSDVKAAIGTVLSDNVQLGGCVTVVDAKKAIIYSKNFGEFFTDQIESAGCVILSRTQDITQSRLDAALDLVKALNPEAVVIAAPWDQLTGTDILSAMAHLNSLDHDLALLAKEHEHHHHHHHDHDDGHEHHHHEHDDEHEHHHHEHDDEHEHHHHDHDAEHEHHHHDHDADEVFQSWGIETMHRFSSAEISDRLAKLDDTETYGTVLRAKGVVPSQEGDWIHFDHVPGEIEIRKGPAGIIGRLCVIGSDLNELNLTNLFSE